MDELGDRTYLREGELVDTYGGDYTYRSIFFVIRNGSKVYYKECYGAKPSEPEEIYDIENYID